MFPVTIKNAYGETRIEKKPERVVVLGWNDLAVASALGAPVVGAVRYFDPANPNLPYITQKYGEDVLGLDAANVNLEKVASYNPDLILAVTSNQLDQARYDKLSQIAPTVAYPKSLYGSTMAEETELIGKALGRTEEAAKLLADANAKIEATKQELPKLAGRTYLFGQARGTVLPLVVGKDNLSTKFMNSLGLKVPDAFANVQASDQLAPGTIGISYEEAARLDSADVLFMTFAGGQDLETFKTNPVTRELKVVKEGRYQATEISVAQLLQAPNAAGVGWLLDQLKPTLKTIGA
ncbi:ABC transporter substrate-binding protein [Lentzea albidocapillata]|uniref:ABC transporter substrate-binding protein n=1 Tax=Lentzea albidocapillata TaxID=40571 RepID=UPI0015A19864|nr:ABC transporter substrate-binding protein [Lentzea albidocapillata]